MYRWMLCKAFYWKMISWNHSHFMFSLLEPNWLYSGIIPETPGKPVASLLLNLFSIENFPSLVTHTSAAVPSFNLTAGLLLSTSSRKNPWNLCSTRALALTVAGRDGGTSTVPRFDPSNPGETKRWCFEETAEPLGQEVWDRLFRENQSYLWTAKRCWQSTKKAHFILNVSKKNWTKKQLPTQ